MKLLNNQQSLFLGLIDISKKDARSVGVENCRYGKAKGKRQEARVKRVWAILRFFTQFGFIVFTYLVQVGVNNTTIKTSENLIDYKA
ncbi:MAG: hypothetical protein AN486_19875 [Anabaena sp. AL93]|nr:MAG: hypothetical protein AN486_19875 [Anabaena sp. AL93]